jgi:secreted trypsin-like serine protease
VRRILGLHTRYLLVVVFGLILGTMVTVPVLAADTEPPQQVVGGEPVPNGDLPFVVSLGDISYGVTAYQRHFCGASLIDSNSVLTAAHCVRGTPTWPLRIVVGRRR